MTSSNSKRRKFTQIAAVAAAGAFVAIGAGAAAFAAPGDPGYNTIDASHPASLTVHKYAAPPGGSLSIDPNGTEITDGSLASLTPLPDAEFTIQRVDPSVYDLSKNSGWEALANLTVADAANKPFDNQHVGTTDDNGEYAFTGLPIGVYLVTETALPDGASVPTAPFLVTLPITNPNDRTAWLYDVHVYPKNDILTPSKTVADKSAVALGDTITWTIASNIPQAQPVQTFKIVDPIAKELGFNQAAKPVVVKIGSTLLTEGTDYTVTYLATDPAIADPTLYPKTLTIELTPSAVAALNAAVAADSTVKITADVPTVVTSIGEIPNKAIIYSNNGSTEVTPVPTNETDSKFGNINIFKGVTTNKTKGLPDAQFQVYLNRDDAIAGENAIKVLNADGITYTNTWTTGPDGTVSISGLRYSDYANGKQLADDSDPAWRYYWIAETQAPDGYHLLAEPVQVVVNTAETDVNVVKLYDAPDNGGFQLPFTGSPLSAALFYGIGSLVLVGAALVIVRNRRKSAAEQA